MPTTLGQIVAIDKSTREEAEEGARAIRALLKRPELFHGLRQTHTAREGYLPRADKFERAQANATEILKTLRPMMTRLMDLTATRDMISMTARADIVVDGNVFLSDVPVTHLLWLEKQLAELLTTFRAIPLVSAAEVWVEDNTLDDGMLRTAPHVTATTTKIQSFEVPVGPTEHHPAIVKEVSKDEHSGDLTTIKYTTGLRPTARETLVNRARTLLESTRRAIVAANRAPVTEDVHEGQKIFDYLLAGVVSAD